MWRNHFKCIYTETEETILEGRRSDVLFLAVNSILVFMFNTSTAATTLLVLQIIR